MLPPLAAAADVKLQASAAAGAAAAVPVLGVHAPLLAFLLAAAHCNHSLPLLVTRSSPGSSRSAARCACRACRRSARRRGWGGLGQERALVLVCGAMPVMVCVPRRERQMRAFSHEAGRQCGPVVCAGGSRCAGAVLTERQLVNSL